MGQNVANQLDGVSLDTGDWHLGNPHGLYMGQAFLHRQLLLVLLPIVALAVFGALGLRRDRSAVEREARERAMEATSRLADRFAEEWPAAFGKAKARWVAGGSNEAFAELRFDPGLRLVRPVECPDAPVPPAWRRILSEPVLTALDGLRQAEASGNADRVRELGTLLRGATGAPPVIHAIAELSQLRVDPGSIDRSGSLLKLAQGALAEQWVNEAGVPLAMSAALCLAGQDPVTIRSPESLTLVEGLVREQPSILTGRLLGMLRAGSGGAEGRERIEGLVREWQALEERRMLAGQVKGYLSSNTLPAGPFWVGDGARRWLADCRIGPEGWVVGLHGRAVLESAAASIREAVGSVGLPAGIQVEVELSGLSLGSSGGDPVAMYAETERRLTSSVSEGEPGLAVVGRFRAELRDPQALFGAQVRQQRLFAGLLAGVVGVAGIGLWQTRRAFLRQLALNEEKTNFVSAVSHELRSPLASLRLLSEALAEGRAEDPAKRREYAAFLVQETRRLGTLVENVLDFSRIEQGRKVYVPEPIDLPRLVHESVRILGPVAEEREVVLRVEVADGAEGIEVSADAAALQQALLNLVDNALKHAPAGTAVEVRLERGADPRWPVRMSVRDSGPGIPVEDHQRIFERFYRRGSELRRETQGVGLGLAIVRHVVEGHGGRVWVESEPGRGAVFFVELPVEAREVNS